MFRMIDDANQTPQVELSVPKRILTSFVEAVEAEEDLTDVARRLRRALLENDDHSEASLQQALFGDVL